MPNKYVVMERLEGDLGFHKIAETSSTHYDIKITDNKIHSFKIIAANEGGLSFPSEVLAMCEGSSDSAPVLVVNGFTRVSGPSHFKEGNRAGFNTEDDFGVPYIKDISFSGYQTEFNRNAGERFGLSGTNYATQVIAGNTFDYAAVHGDAIAETGAAFVSCGLGALEKGRVRLSDYKTVDLILGKQKTTVVGNGKSGVNYRAFPAFLQKEIKGFLNKGGHLIVSGQYVASDLFDTRSSEKDREFAEKVLGVVPAESVRSVTVDEEGTEHISEPQARQRVRDGRIRSVTGGNVMDYSNTLNDKMYIVENPDVLVAAEGSGAIKTFTFSDTSRAAGYSHKSGKGKVDVISIPIESFTEQADRDRVMKTLLK